MGAACYFNHLKQFFTAVFALPQYLIICWIPWLLTPKRIMNRFTYKEIEIQWGWVTSQCHTDNGKLDLCHLDLIFQLQYVFYFIPLNGPKIADEGPNNVPRKDFCDNFSVSFSFPSFLHILLLSDSQFSSEFVTHMFKTFNNSPSLLNSVQIYQPVFEFL